MYLSHLEISVGKALKLEATVKLPNIIQQDRTRAAIAPANVLYNNKKINPFSAWTVYRRQNLTSMTSIVDHRTG